MRLLILSSVWPSFTHARAAYVVLAVLLRSLAEQGHQVGWAVVLPSRQPDERTRAELDALGVQFVGDFTDQTIADPTMTDFLPGRLRAYLGDLLAPLEQSDYPAFRDPQAVADRLRAFRPDAAVLFWDTFFEHLVPAMPDVPVIGYWARPRTEAPLAVLDTQPFSLRRWIQRRRLLARRRRHLERARLVARRFNICAQDTAWYRANGLDCDYLSNTWPDAFGADCRELRASAEAARPGLEILGNIGDVGATGNSFGMEYLGQQVIPHLQTLLAGRDWGVNICGGGTMKPHVAAALDHPRIRILGFVPDIDLEILSNPIFLLCNNAGPYTGGYTRVIYVMSSAGVLVAHAALALSMPELVHGENCLLGHDGAEIAALVARLADDAELRRRIGDNARRTYESHYAPSMVAARIAAAAAA